MTKEIISTDKAPQAIGTYSQAVKTGNTVYLSGQIPLIPETMEMVEGDIRLQMEGNYWVITGKKRPSGRPQK